MKHIEEGVEFEVVPGDGLLPECTVNHTGPTQVFSVPRTPMVVE